MYIRLQDNQFTPTEWNDESFGKYDKGKYEHVLKELDGISLSELCSEKWSGKKYLVFPRNSDRAKKELNKKDNFIYKLQNRNREKPAFQTCNVMGFLQLNDEVQMRITSRFDDFQKNGGKNYFLHYMLQKVNNVAFVPHETDSDEDEFYEFLYYLFPSYLNEACAQGIFRAYVTNEYNDANVRGPIDISRHIRYNIPFNGKIAYHTREYTTDNKVTQLIRHTIEYIRTLGLKGSVLECNKDVKDNVNAVVATTGTYDRNSRHKVIAQNLHPITHPYYTAYEPLREICLAILCHKKMSYGNDNDNPIAGILFDGASLWEEYLAKIFEESTEQGFKCLTHSNNRDKTDGVKMFENGGNYYPDFYRKNFKESNTIGDCNGFVLDAKYKQLYTSKHEISDGDDELEDDSSKGTHFHFQRNDLFQMLAYMHALKANNAILLSPYVSSSEEIIIKSSKEDEKEKKALGYGGEINIVAMPIYTNFKDFEAFSNHMKNVENEFLIAIKKILGS